MVSNHGFIGLTLFVGLFVAAFLDAQWLIRRTRDNVELAWANNFGRMLQASLVGFGVGGSFGNLDMYDGFYVLVILVAAARRIVAAELASQRRVAGQPIAGAAPAVAAAADARAARPLVPT
jgi:putative inorganic carbon (hco3(-)) transporter